jgi:hypothetical protein
MTAREFCYWLNGAREICNQLSFNEYQVKVIFSHLNMVKVYTNNFTTGSIDQNTEAFCKALDSLQTLEIKEFSPSILKGLYKQLDKIFAHVIDPTYGNESMQDKLNILHNSTTNMYGYTPEEWDKLGIKPRC